MKKSIEKEQTYLVEKIQFIKPFIFEDEKIFLITKGCTPFTFLESMTVGAMITVIKRALFVFTNKRILHIPVGLYLSYKHSIAEINYADCNEIVMSTGLFSKNLYVKYKSGKTEKFTAFHHSAKKIKKLLESIPLEGTPSNSRERYHLCPRCTKPLTKDKYTCPNCRLEFKNKQEARKISILLPGGGYFYTRHPILGLGDAITETIFILLIIGSWLSMDDPTVAPEEGIAGMVVFGIILLIEKIITVYHSNHFIKEFIPKEKEIKIRKPI